MRRAAAADWLYKASGGLRSGRGRAEIARPSPGRTAEGSWSAGGRRRHGRR